MSVCSNNTAPSFSCLFLLLTPKEIWRAQRTDVWVIVRKWRVHLADWTHDLLKLGSRTWIDCSDYAYTKLAKPLLSRWTMAVQRHTFTSRDSVVWYTKQGARAVVEALRYTPEGLGIDFRLCYWNLHWHNPSGRTMALGSIQPLTEISTRNISWG
jgi:hypothetical protein